MSRFQRSLLLWSSGLTFLTGVVYWWMDTMLDPVTEWAVVNHPLQAWVLKAHILVAPVLIFAIGLVMTDHIWKHLRTAVTRGRRSGAIAMCVLVPMILSGYLIQAVTAENWLTVVVWAHLITGGLYGLALATHTLLLTRTTGRNLVPQDAHEPLTSPRKRSRRTLIGAGTRQE